MAEINQQPRAGDQPSPNGVVEWLMFFYAILTAGFSMLWFLGMHGSDGAGMPYSWFSLELVIGCLLSGAMIVVLAKPLPRACLPIAMVLAAYHSILGVQYVVGMPVARSWSLLPLAYSICLVAMTTLHLKRAPSARPN